MHLDWPRPDWPTWDPWGGPDRRGPWPERPLITTFVWSEGQCWLGLMKANCGEAFDLNARIALVAPFSLGAKAIFSAVSNEPENVKILKIEPSHVSDFSVTIKGEIADDWTGTAVICVQAHLAGGTLLEKLVFEKPNTPRFWSPSLDWAAAELPLVFRGETKEYWWNCGCIETEVDCCDETTPVAWDDAGSDDTIAQSATAALAVTGSGGPFTWSVAETGFSIERSITAGLTNTLIADAAACGLATITVTDCDGNADVGYVRCTEGTWALQGTCCPCCGACQGMAGDDCEEYACAGVILIEGNKKWLVGISDKCYVKGWTSAYNSGCACDACSWPQPPGGSSPYICFRYYLWECA